jgi:hypothetical protein
LLLSVTNIDETNAAEAWDRLRGLLPSLSNGGLEISR